MNSPALDTATEPGKLPKADKADVDAARKPGKFQISPEVKASLERTQSQDDGSGYVSDRHNSSGVHVKFWQEQINSYRLSKGILPIPETGTVDKVTTEAIKEMQRDLGVADDGVIGPRTFRAFALKYQGGSDQVDGLFFQDFQVRLLSQAEYDAMIALSTSRRLSSLKFRFDPSFPLPEGINPKEINPEEFQKIMDRYGKGQIPISAQDFLRICIEYNMDPTQAMIDLRLKHLKYLLILMLRKP